jgi:hypothetical protein
MLLIFPCQLTAPVKRTHLHAASIDRIRTRGQPWEPRGKKVLSLKLETLGGGGHTSVSKTWSIFNSKAQYSG